MKSQVIPSRDVVEVGSKSPQPPFTKGGQGKSPFRKGGFRGIFLPQHDRTRGDFRYDTYPSQPLDGDRKLFSFPVVAAGLGDC